MFRLLVALTPLVIAISPGRYPACWIVWM
uniref:G_PROTEIN_RECEP_F1_2 domain-containing protein n=1 Tax=Heterorhabditis bacteriophora TaxID=37862 RepID=A0A1I7WDK9_HETBA